MLEQLNLGLKLSKKDYRRRLPALQDRLHQLQRACWEAGLGSLIVFEGWEVSGKGSTIRKLTERLEPRGFALHTTTEARTLERQLPWLGRFWATLPAYGHLAIYFRSWYRRVLLERVEQGLSEEVCRRAFHDILAFERALAEDRYVLVKLFLHLDREEQGRRLQALVDDERTAWKVDPKDWRRHEQYDALLGATETMLERSESEWAPWTLVEAHDKRWTRIKVFEAVVRQLEEGLIRHGHSVPEPTDDSNSDAPSSEEGKA